MDIERGHWAQYYPLATLTEGGPIEFAVSGSGEDYLDLSNTLLEVKAKIVKGTGNALADTDVVGPVNLWLHSLFSQVDVVLNGQVISAPNHTYPYRAYLETLCSYGGDAKSSQLSSLLFAKDTPGQMDTATLVAGGNQGLRTRQTETAVSHKVNMMGRLHADIFMQERFLPNGVDLKLRLIPSKNAFNLMSSVANPSFRTVLEEVSLYVRKVKLSPSTVLAHAKAVEKSRMKLPLRRVVCKSVTVPAGSFQANLDNLFLGQLPNRIIVGCVAADAFNGSYTANPFNFQHFGLNFLALHVNGEQVPAKPLQPNFEDRQYVRSYLSLFSGTGMLHQDVGNGISYNDYPQGYTLYAFDLTPDLGEEEAHFNVVREGNLRAELHFAAALTASINVVIYAEFDNVVEIDKARNVLVDF